MNAEPPSRAFGGHYDESLHQSKIKPFDGLDKLVLSNRTSRLRYDEAHRCLCFHSFACNSLPIARSPWEAPPIRSESRRW
jgi:hypothetical protein